MSDRHPFLATCMALLSICVAGLPLGASAMAHHRVPAPSASPYPFANGDAWITSVSGTETVTIPPAQPTTVPYGYTQTDVESCPVSFNGYTNLCADQFLQSPYQDTSETFYFGYFTNGPLLDFTQVGGALSLAQNGNSTNDVWTMTPGNIYLQFGGTKGSRYNGWTGVYRESDLTYGPHRYTSTASYVLHENASDVHTNTNEPAQHTKITTKKIISPGGSGEYDYAQTGPSATKTTEAFGKPVQGSGGWVIPVSITTNGNTTNTNVPDWFPGAGPAPSKLDTIVIEDDGSVQMPSACGVYAGSPAEQYHYVRDYELDPVSGWYFWYTGDAYVVFGVGTVCTPETWNWAYYDNTSTGHMTESVQIADTQILQSYTYGQALVRGLLRRAVRKQGGAGFELPSRFGRRSELGEFARGLRPGFKAAQ